MHRGPSLIEQRPVVDRPERNVMNVRLSEFVAEHVREVLGRLVVLDNGGKRAAARAQGAAYRSPQPPTCRGKARKSPPPVPPRTRLPRRRRMNSPRLSKKQTAETVTPLSGAGQVGWPLPLYRRPRNAFLHADVAQQLRGLSETDKPRLARLGLRFGVESGLSSRLAEAGTDRNCGRCLWNLYHADCEPGVFHAPPVAGRVTS